MQYRIELEMWVAPTFRNVHNIGMRENQDVLYGNFVGEVESGRMESIINEGELPTEMLEVGNGART